MYPVQLEPPNPSETPLKPPYPQEVSGDTGYMVYVSDVNKITRRDLDGSNPKVILSANVVKIGCIALSGQWVSLFFLILLLGT